jgi:hypothetical protein
MGNLTGESHWLVVNARATYSGGSGNFVQDESVTGTDRFSNSQNQQIAVTGTGDRPVLTGDLNATLFPFSKLTVVNNSSVADTRMVGNNLFTDYNNATFSYATVNFQFLGIRLFTNATDVRYRFSRKFDIYGGFRYADRLIRSTEDTADAGTAFGGVSAQQSNHTTAGVAGINWMPVSGLRAHAETEIGTNDNPFTPVSQRAYQVLRARAQYGRKNATFGGSYQESYNNNSIEVTAYSSHARTYSGYGSWAIKARNSLDLSYTKLHMDTLGGIAFFAGAPRPVLNSNPDSLYVSNIHALNAGLRFGATRRVDLYVGYSLTKDTGDGRGSLAVQPTAAGQVFYNVQTFPLTYQTPVVRVSVRIAEKLRWNAGYQYYGYREEFGLLSANQNYRANTAYTSLTWAF